MENLVIDREFWRDKTVLLTGHTGFKGAWLALWLQSMGARVVGFALSPSTTPNLFELARVEEGMISIIGDIRNRLAIQDAVTKYQPEIVIHMAAQALVRRSYVDPVETYATNVMGTVHVFEAVRLAASTRVVLNVTSDKCYENREPALGHDENDAMGGHDPYSSSKGCSELVTASYRRSFFNQPSDGRAPVFLASARAGNVIGGGDWAGDRLVPDIMRAILAARPVVIRYPAAIRPWQHVLEPLAGYLVLVERLWADGQPFAEAWNFGPADRDAQPVSYVADTLTRIWGEGAVWTIDEASHPHEARYLKLNCAKAASALGWRPRWSLDEALASVVDWHRDYRDKRDVRQTTLRQIEQYEGAMP